MFRQFTNKGAVAIIASMAMLLQALWPLLSHARPAEKGEMVRVCSIAGATHYIELKTGKQSPLDQRSAAHGEHCKLCVLEGPHDAVLAPILVAFLIVPSPSDAFPRIEFPAISFVSPLHAHPRAPPASL